MEIQNNNTTGDAAHQDIHSVEHADDGGLLFEIHESGDYPLTEDEDQGYKAEIDEWLIEEGEANYGPPSQALLTHLEELTPTAVKKYEAVSIKKAITSFQRHHHITKKGKWHFHNHHTGKITITQHPEHIDPHNPDYKGQYTTTWEHDNKHIHSDLTIRDGEWVIHITAFGDDGQETNLE